MIRRLLLGVALAGSCLLALAPPASAASPSGAWTDPEPDRDIDGVPLATLERPGPLKGVVEFDGGITSVSFRLTKDGGAEATDPCSAVDDVKPQVKNTDSTRVVFSFEAAFPCNHRYQVTATATPAQRPLRNDTPADFPLWIDVAIPPAATSGLTATSLSSRRAVSLRWEDATHEPDFTGYEVRRSVDGARFAKVGTAGPSATSYVDEDVPRSGGELAYHVVGIRSGPRDGSTIYADDGDPASVSFAALPGSRTDGSTDGGSAGTTSGSGRADSSGLRSALPGGGGSRTAVGTYRPPATPTTIDPGYQETLPFQRRNDQALPNGDPAVVARFDDSDEDGTRQTALLVAGGGVAFSWAMALRLLSRRFSGV